jgi:hypothetical protein
LRLSGDIGNKKDADAIARKVTVIVSANASKRTLDNAVAQWLAEIGDDLHSAASLRSAATKRGKKTGVVPGKVV